jgi:two-component system cell cycle sensor histidine kinase/response regulator CckA
MAVSKQDQGVEPKATILLVDDDPHDRELMRVLLCKEMYHVIEASDGHEALTHFEKHSHAIHLLLTDIHMPGMDGVELAKKILSLNPETKILFASGFRHNFASEIDGHPVDFIEKTPNLPNLSQKVQEVLFPTNPIKKLWNKFTAAKD